VYIPFDVIQSAGAQIMVNVATDDVVNQGWQNLYRQQYKQAKEPGVRFNPSVR
jgi:hypothetical protein